MRANGLQEGDFIVIYSDVKCGKYVNMHHLDYLFILKVVENKIGIIYKINPSDDTRSESTATSWAEIREQKGRKIAEKPAWSSNQSSWSKCCVIFTHRAQKAVRYAAAIT